MSSQQSNTEFVVHLRALANMLDCAENAVNRIVPGIVRSIREAADIIDACEKVSVYKAVERKRQKGCPYCTGNVNERPLLLEEVGGVYIDGNGNMTIEDDGAAINCCYMCGRDLKGENNDNGAGN